MLALESISGAGAFLSPAHSAGPLYIFEESRDSFAYFAEFIDSDSAHSYIIAYVFVQPQNMSPLGSHRKI